MKMKTITDVEAKFIGGNTAEQAPALDAILEAAEAAPAHGDYGAHHVTTTKGYASTSTVWSPERWCATCSEWVFPRNVVSLVLGTVCCHKCKTPWEPRRSSEPDIAEAWPGAANKDGYTE